jgi:hypothetical protein
MFSKDIDRSKKALKSDLDRKTSIKINEIFKENSTNLNDFTNSLSRITLSKKAHDNVVKVASKCFAVKGFMQAVNNEKTKKSKSALQLTNKYRAYLDGKITKNSIVKTIKSMRTSKHHKTSLENYLNKQPAPTETTNKEVVKATDISEVQKKFIIYLGAQHLSKAKEFRGGMSRYHAIQEMKDTLKAMPNAQQVGSKFEKLYQLISESEGIAYAIDRIYQEPDSTKMVANWIRSKVEKLNSGDSVAIPCGSHRHATMLLLTCTGVDAHGQENYKIELHNEGQGIENHPQKMINGETKVQTALIYEDIPEEKLLQGGDFFYGLMHGISNENINVLYSTLDQLGPRSPESPDLRHWSSGQEGDTCSTQCLISLMRSYLSDEEYSLFKTHARKQMLMSTVKNINSKEGDPTFQKIIALEIIGKLERHHAKRKIELDQEIKDVKSELLKIENTGTAYLKLDKYSKKHQYSRLEQLENQLAALNNGEDVEKFLLYIIQNANLSCAEVEFFIVSRLHSKQGKLLNQEHFTHLNRVFIDTFGAPSDMLPLAAKMYT